MIADRNRAIAADQLIPIEGEPDVYSFETVLPAGRYFFCLDSVQLPGEVQIKRGQVNHVSLKLPELMDVTLVIEDQSGNIADTELIVWLQTDGQARPFVGHSVRRRPTERAFRFVAPLGQLVVATVRTPAQQRFEITRGPNELKMVLPSPTTQLQRRAKTRGE